MLIVDGNVLSVQSFDGNSFEPLPAGSRICLDGGGIARFTVSLPALVELPPSIVSVRSSFLSDVVQYRAGDAMIVSLRPDILPVSLLIGVFGIALIIFVLYRIRSSDRDYRGVDERVLAYVAKHPGCTQKDISIALGLEKYQVSRILSRMESRGQIIRIRRGISKRVYLPQQLQ